MKNILFLLLLLVIPFCALGQGQQLHSGVPMYSLSDNGEYKIGIGTASPEYMLDVHGVARFSQIITGMSDKAGLIINRKGNGVHTLFQRKQQSIGYFGTHDAKTSFFLTSYKDLAFRTRGSDKNAVYISRAGSVGIGTDLPSNLLHVAGTSYFEGDIKLENNKSFTWKGSSSSVRDENKQMKFTAQKAYHFDVGGIRRFSITLNGNVGIGTATPAHKLQVIGDSHFVGPMQLDGLLQVKMVKVNPAQGSVPDYVFRKDYDLRTIQALEEFIRAHSHLPNVPSAQEMETHGQNLGELQLKLLEKIEELTLYIIDQNKEIQQLRVEVNALKSGN